MQKGEGREGQWGKEKKPPNLTPNIISFCFLSHSVTSAEYVVFQQQLQ